MVAHTIPVHIFSGAITGGPYTYVIRKCLFEFGCFLYTKKSKKLFYQSINLAVLVQALFSFKVDGVDRIDS